MKTLTATNKFIFNEVRIHSYNYKGLDQWLKRSPDVYEKIAYLNPDRPTDGSVNKLAFNVGEDKTRMKIKTGRFLTKKLALNHDYLDDKTISSIAEAINIELFPVQEIELVKGNRITENYRAEVGGGSCMTDSDYKKSRMYENNPDIYQQLTMHAGNNSARAMVIKLDNGKFLMDRVYSDCSSLVDAMFDYAKKQGWFYREFTDAGETSIAFNDEKVDDYEQFIVSDVSYDEGEVPYADTLRKFRESGGCIDIFHSRSNYSSDGDLDSTEGTILEDRHCCEDCGDSMCEDDCFYIGDRSICRYCVENHYFRCERCEEMYNDDNSTSVDGGNIYVCHDCASNHYQYCESCEEYFSEITYTNDERYLCEGCLTYDYSLCEDCGAWFLKDTIDEDDHCEGCHVEEDKDDAE